MALRNTSWFKFENIDVDELNGDQLFAIAEYYGFPELTVSHPRDSMQIHIAGTRAAWINATRYLERNDMLKSAYLALDDSLGKLGDQPAPELPEVIKATTVLAWQTMDKWLERVCTMSQNDYYCIRAMLAHAAARNFPELTIPAYNYTICGDIESWLTAAKLFAGSPAIVLATQKLIELDASGNPNAPIDNTTQRNGGYTAVKIHITGE